MYQNCDGLHCNVRLILINYPENKINEIRTSQHNLAPRSILLGIIMNRYRSDLHSMGLQRLLVKYINSKRDLSECDDNEYIPTYACAYCVVYTVMPYIMGIMQPALFGRIPTNDKIPWAQVVMPHAVKYQRLYLIPSCDEVDSLAIECKCSVYAGHCFHIYNLYQYGTP